MAATWKTQTRIQTEVEPKVVALAIPKVVAQAIPKVVAPAVETLAET